MSDRPDRVQCCPECEDGSIYFRRGSGTYRCQECGEVFDEPITREPRTGGWFR